MSMKTLISVLLLLALFSNVYASEEAQTTNVTPMSAAQISETLGPIRALIDNKGFASASAKLNELLVVARKNNQPKLEYYALSFLNDISFVNNHDMQEVIRNELKQEALAKQIKSDALLAEVSNNLGYDLLVTGSEPVDQILSRLVLANDYYAAENSDNGRWYTLMNLAWAYRLNDQHYQSEKFGLLAIKAANQLADRHAIIETSVGHALTLLQQGKLEQSQKYFEMGKASVGEVIDRDKYVFDVFHAKYLWARGDKLEAIKSTQNAIEFLQGKEIFFEMTGRSYLADMYFEEGKHALAEQQVDLILSNRNKFVSRQSLHLAERIKSLLVTQIKQTIESRLSGYSRNEHFNCS